METHCASGRFSLLAYARRPPRENFLLQINQLLHELGAPAVPIYKPEQFKEMLAKERVETVVITCVDALHDLYIVPALEAGGMLIAQRVYLPFAHP